MPDTPDTPQPPTPVGDPLRDAPRPPGRPARLSKARIVEAALALADARGLGSVTMRSVAHSLDSTPGSLYRHVSNRDDLIVAMQDKALAGLQLEGSDLEDFDLEGSGPGSSTYTAVRADLERLAGSLVDLHRAHPWLADIAPAPQPVGRSADLVAAILSILRRPGAPESRQWAGLAVFLNLVAGLGRWSGDAAAQGEAATQRDAAWLPDTTTATGIIVDAVFGVLFPAQPRD